MTIVHSFVLAETNDPKVLRIHQQNPGSVKVSRTICGLIYRRDRKRNDSACHWIKEAEFAGYGGEKWRCPVCFPQSV